jgi:4-hydroxybenzoate polyprenyltransferase/phosphoserine phosphatase
VDLDGTLIRSDLLIETGFAKVCRDPSSVHSILLALMHGKANLKHHLALTADLDPALLPYDDAVLDCIRQAIDAGRAVYLVSASNQILVQAVAEHLGVFSGWFASDQTVNLSGDAKAARLVAAFGERGFDYIGNDAADLAVWAHARKAIAIRVDARVSKRLAKLDVDVQHLDSPRPSWRTWAKLLRVHQFAKNALIFVPLLTSHLFTVNALVSDAMAFVAFSLCASSVYILNDLADLQADRSHRSKKFRPLASGAIPLIQGLYAAPLLFATAVALAAAVSVEFLAVLLSYFALTTAYSFFLKRKMLVDVLTLAILYVVRVIAGAVAIEVVVSEWLLAFSMFMFVSLALIKRYVELTTRLDSGLPDPTNRNYKQGDVDVVAALAAAAGFNAVTVFALYISSPAVHDLYRRPQLLWLICPILLYWISRALLMAHRRFMDDDPITFALKDKNSLIAAVLIALLIGAAI